MEKLGLLKIIRFLFLKAMDDLKCYVFFRNATYFRCNAYFAEMDSINQTTTK